MTQPIWTDTGLLYDFGFIGEAEALGLRLTVTGSDLEVDAGGTVTSGTVTGYSTSVYYSEDVGLDDRVIAVAQDITEDWPTLQSSEQIDVMYFLSIIQLTEAAKAREALDADFETFGVHITSQASNTTLRGTALDEAFHLQGAQVVLKTGAGRDLVETELAIGRNYINLGHGDDLFMGGAVENRVWGAQGHDVLTGGEVTDKLIGGTGNDTLSGAAGHDVLRGGEGRDSVAGGAGDDILMGGAGRDNLFAGPGDDRLWGGEGGDAFVFNVDRYHWHDPEVGHNRVMDFDLSEDKLRLGPSDNGTWDADVALEKFLDGAEARGWGTVYKEDGMNIYLIGVTLGDLTVEHFVNGATVGSYDDWLYA